MSKRDMGFHFSLVEINNIDTVRSIRLVDVNNQAYIAVLTENKDIFRDHILTLHAINIDTNIFHSPHVLFNLHSLFGSPDWDIINGASGISVVWTIPGSMGVKLGYRRVGNEDILLTDYSLILVLQNPRFVRRYNTVAVIASNGSYTDDAIVLLNDALEKNNEQSHYSTLPSYNSGGVFEGILIKQGEGFLLITRIRERGEDIRSERKDVYGYAQSSGYLICVQLNAAFEPVGVSTSPVGDTLVFEVDADAVGDKVYLFATTKEGYVATTATVTNQTIQWAPAVSHATAGDYFAPGVLATGESAIVVVLERKKKSDASTGPQLLLGRF